MKDIVMRYRKVWDLPVRIFHWLLVLLILAAWATQETPLADMDLHALIGRTIIALVVFRLAWGLIGSRTARFASFVRGPAAALAHLRDLLARRPYHADGHNALGGLAVLALLGAVAIQAISGLFSTDDILFEGPLAGFVSYSTQIAATEFHEIWFTVLLIVIIVHVGAVAAYRFLLRENLVRPMITGSKPVPTDDASPDNSGGSPLRFGISISVAALAWWAIGLA
jgi:cytochrome b